MIGRSIKPLIYASVNSYEPFEQILSNDSEFRKPL